MIAIGRLKGAFEKQEPHTRIRATVYPEKNDKVFDSFPKSYITRHALAPFLPT